MLDGDDVLWIDERKACEFVHVKVHEKELVRGRVLDRFIRELLIKVAEVSATLLQPGSKISILFIYYIFIVLHFFIINSHKFAHTS